MGKNSRRRAQENSIGNAQSTDSFSDSPSSANNKQWIRTSVVSVVCLLIGAALGFLSARIYYQGEMNTSAEDNAIVRAGGYNYINPIISCDISDDKKFAEFQPIEDKLDSYIDQNIANGNAQDISVYFRGLNSGEWSGVNENDLYSPASLLKVPIMIAYLKESETDPSILTKQIVYRQTTDENAAETIKPAQSIQSGQTYTIMQLIQYMIMYSDNNAATYLANNINPNALDEVYSDLGLQIPPASDIDEPTVSVKMYSNVFNVLYNAGYLHKTQSQQALELLTQADFPQGIESGVASGTPVAQKFGERTSLIFNPTTEQSTVDFRELHDCGVIYYPDNPYVLCVMTKGTNFTVLTKIISDISTLIYQETNSGVLKL